MVLQSVFKCFWIYLLLFTIGSCVPVQKSQTGEGYYYSRGSVYRRGRSGGVSNFGVGSDSGVGSGSSTSFSGVSADYSAAQEAEIAEMVATLLGLSPDGSRPVLQGRWSARNVPLGMVATRPVYPSSLVVHTGYQRARGFRTDSKYTQDASDHIPVPGTPQNPGSGSEGHQMGQ